MLLPRAMERSCTGKRHERVSNSGSAHAPPTDPLAIYAMSLRTWSLVASILSRFIGLRANLFRLSSLQLMLPLQPSADARSNRGFAKISCKIQSCAEPPHYMEMFSNQPPSHQPQGSRLSIPPSASRLSFLQVGGKAAAAAAAAAAAVWGLGWPRPRIISFGFLPASSASTEGPPRTCPAVRQEGLACS